MKSELYINIVEMLYNAILVNFEELALASKHNKAATQRAVATESKASDLSAEVEKLRAEAEDTGGQFFANIQTST